MRERMVFDPERLREALRVDLCDGLRAVADALERGELQGWLVSAAGHGFCAANDNRAHVLVRINLASEVFRWEDGRKVFGEPVTVELPASKKATRRLRDGGCDGI